MDNNTASVIKLQERVVEFITSVILNHESNIKDLVNLHFGEEKESILTTNNQTIIEMIGVTTNHFYNQLYYQIQNNKPTETSRLILSMSEDIAYGSHVLLDKLIRLTLDIHVNINREELDSNAGIENFHKSLLRQINNLFMKNNLYYYLAPKEEDAYPFVNIPEGEKAFNIVIKKDKNI